MDKDRQGRRVWEGWFTDVGLGRDRGGEDQDKIHIHLQTEGKGRQRRTIDTRGGSGGETITAIEPMRHSTAPVLPEKLPFRVPPHVTVLLALLEAQSPVSASATHARRGNPSYLSRATQSASENFPTHAKERSSRGTPGMGFLTVTVWSSSIQIWRVRRWDRKVLCRWPGRRA